MRVEDHAAAIAEILKLNLATCYGKMSPEHSAATKEKTSRQSSRKSSGSKNRESVMCLCLRKTSGPQPGLYTMNWGDGASHGEYTMHSTGEYRKDESGSLLLRILTDSQQAPLYLALDSGEKPQEPVHTKLSEILETDPDPKYNLSAKACQGILRRAERRGKKLPEQLEQALTGDHENRVTDYTAISCYNMQGFGDYRESDASSACKARDYKDATDLVVGTFQNTGQGWWKESDTGASIRLQVAGKPMS